MILLSFDIEEFDMPFEYGRELSFDEQIAISEKGAILILELLKKNNVCATFYCTANFALQRPAIIKQIIQEGHEVASHGYYHSDFKTEHLLQSKKILEEISRKEIHGYRMARMMPVDEKEINRAGYLYNSSINPTYLPGRYNNLSVPRTYFYKETVLQLPASVSPFLRFPLFWLTFHNLPMWIILHLCKRVIKKDSYLNLYFHPWEFVDISNKKKFNFPKYISRYSGEKMKHRLEEFINWAKKENHTFCPTIDFVESINAKIKR